ncbi:MAG TPA: hypothetical protein PLF22_02985 [Pseudomonadales bacterium]|nr:hypothetical protein [Pseudomonadales bacterium]
MKADGIWMASVRAVYLLACWCTTCGKKPHSNAETIRDYAILCSLRIIVPFFTGDE